jgi:hypothetical protein
MSQNNTTFTVNLIVSLPEKSLLEYHMYFYPQKIVLKISGTLYLKMCPFFGIYNLKSTDQWSKHNLVIMQSES